MGEARRAMMHRLDMRELTTDDRLWDTSHSMGPRIPQPQEALEAFMDVEYMQRFTRRERQAMILHHACMLEIEEIAKYLEITYKAAQKALERAKAKCEP